jgi:hypothetical protein
LLQVGNSVSVGGAMVFVLIASESYATYIRFDV